MQRAASAGMVPRNESWTIPFIVVEWTVIAVGLIMAMAVVLMN